MRKLKKLWEVVGIDGEALIGTDSAGEPTRYDGDDESGCCGGEANGGEMESMAAVVIVSGTLVLGKQLFSIVDDQTDSEPRIDEKGDEKEGFKNAWIRHSECWPKEFSRAERDDHHTEFQDRWHGNPREVGRTDGVGAQL